MLCFAAIIVQRRHGRVFRGPAVVVSWAALEVRSGMPGRPFGVGPVGVPGSTISGQGIDTGLSGPHNGGMTNHTSTTTDTHNPYGFWEMDTLGNIRPGIIRNGRFFWLDGSAV